MSKYILIHGSLSGGWCWTKVKDILKGKGHKVIAPDLPGHKIGSHISSLEVNMDRYVSFVHSLIESEGQMVILVGHSLGGAVITKVIDEISDDIVERAYFVSALIPKNGDIIGKMLKEDIGSQLHNSFKINSDKNTIVFKWEGFRRIKMRISIIIILINILIINSFCDTKKSWWHVYTDFNINSEISIKKGLVFNNFSQDSLKLSEIDISNKFIENNIYTVQSKHAKIMSASSVAFGGLGIFVFLFPVGWNLLNDKKDRLSYSPWLITGASLYSIGFSFSIGSNKITTTIINNNNLNIKSLKTVN